MTSTDRLIGKCTLAEIRKADGAQKYLLDNGEVEWITGWPRASNVSVGDRGKIVYRSTPSYGLHFFIKE